MEDCKVHEIPCLVLISRRKVKINYDLIFSRISLRDSNVYMFPVSSQRCTVELLSGSPPAELRPAATVPGQLELGRHPASWQSPETS